MQPETSPSSPQEQVRVAVQGTDPDHAIDTLAGIYRGKAWYSRSTEHPFAFRYGGFGDDRVSFRRSTMSGYLRGDVATEDQIVVQWLETGSGRVDIDRGEVRMRPGVPIMFPQGQRFFMECRDWDQRLIHLDLAYITEIAAERGATVPLTFDHTVEPTASASAAWFQAVREASHAYQHDGPASLAWHEALRGLALAFLDLYPPRLEPVGDGAAERADRAVRNAIDFVQEHVAEPMTVGRISSAVGVSIRTLQTDFQRLLGRSPMDYLREARLERTHIDLTLGTPETETIRQVARRWGFTHMGRFSGTYRARYDEYPTDTLVR